MRKPIKVGVAALILVAVYFVGLIGGLYTLCYMAGGWKRDDLENYTQQRIIEYMNTGRVNNWNNGGIAVIAYNEDGKFKDFFRQNGDPFVIEFVLQSENYIPTVLSGKSTMKLYAFVKDYSKLGYTSYLYVGLPMRTNDEICGAFFWIEEIADLSGMLIAYAIILTMFFVAISVFVVAYFRMHHNYETMRGKYIDNITHELKSPIASIRALAESLTDRTEKTENERIAHYGMIIGEANRQEKMILNVLTLAKLQSAPTKPRRHKVSSSEIFGPICEKHEALCELVEVDFQVSSDIYALPQLYTDPQTIRQVLEIVLSNARKFISENGRISLSATVQRRCVTICVADNGIGIPQKDLPYVFERFYKGNQQCNDAGSGLGLAIAKESLAALKEKIWVSSEENMGTSIFFTITRAK